MEKIEWPEKEMDSLKMDCSEGGICACEAWISFGDDLSALGIPLPESAEEIKALFEDWEKNKKVCVKCCNEEVCSNVLET